MRYGEMTDELCGYIYAQPSLIFVMLRCLPF